MMRPMLLLAACAMMGPSPAVAQSAEGARELNVGIPVRGAPRKSAEADLYHFLGEIGAKQRIVLKIEGMAGITLFTPGGQEMLSVEGTGTVTLEAVLPYSDVYTIAISRKAPSQAYTLSREASEPTVAEAVIAESTGYRGVSLDKNGQEIATHKCWVIPGVKIRITYPQDVEDIALAADRQTLLYTARTPSRVITGEVAVRLEGDDLVRSLRTDDGKTHVTRYAFETVPAADTSFTYERYRCAD